MYVTRPLSMYKRNLSALSEPPPAGPNSGYLVIFDEATQTYSFFGLFKDHGIKNLPFPQNKNLTIFLDLDNYEETLFIPVLNQPLSSNRYYVIPRKGKHQGKACTSSKEEDMDTCLCYKFVDDVKPRPLDPFNEYQQFEIIKNRDDSFHAKSFAPNGIPPGLLRSKKWVILAKTPRNYHLSEASGSNDSLRAQLPNFNFPISDDNSESAIVGKWYCPFMFVKEEMRLKDQMENSVFYKVTLEQRWEKIFSKENRNDGEEDSVFVDVVVQAQVVKVDGKEVVWDENEMVDRVLWFKSFDDVGGKSVGLRMEIVERMKWEQERFGWIAGNKRQVRVQRVGEFGRKNWKRFGCYVLVESFVLRRMDRRLVLTCDYRHTHQIRCKWE